MRKSSKMWKMSLALGLLALALSACGGNSKNDKKDASPSASSSPSASESSSASPSPSASESPSATPSASDSVEASETAGSAPAIAAGFKLFEDKTYGMSIQYPEEWTLQENMVGAISAFLSPLESDSDTFSENVTIVVEDLKGKDLTLEQYAEVTKTQIGKLVTGSEIIESGASKSEDGTDFYNLIYSGKQGEVSLNWQQAFTIIGGKAYIFTYTAEPDSFDTFVETAGAMIDTWVING